MDPKILSFTVLLTFFIFVFIVLKKPSKRSKIFCSTSKLPPGPWKLPIIGSLHHLVGPLPHRKFRDLANKYGPVMYLEIGQVPTIVISSPNYVKELIQNHDVNFASRPRSFASRFVVYDFDDIMFSPYGDFWRNLRKVFVRELFSAKKAQYTFKPIVEDEMFNLVELIASDVESTINLSKLIKLSICRVISRVTFGDAIIKGYDNNDDVNNLTDIVEEGSLLAAQFHLPEFFPSLDFLSGAREKFEILRRKADKIMENIISKRQEKKRMRTSCETEEEYFVDILLKFHENNEQGGFFLTMDNIKALIWDIFSAGSKSSITTTNWAMAEMIKNPKVMKKTQQEVREVFRNRGKVDEEGINEMTYLKCVVKETLRLHSPVGLIPKECTEKCEIGEFEIPAKTRVMINLWAIGRDPRFWTDPERFLPERFLESSCVDYKGRDFEYLPFGAGRRICPGISLGVINVEVQIAFLLYHFDWKLPDGMNTCDLDMAEVYGLTVKRKHDLHLIPMRVSKSGPLN